jgi:hypothetical protein
MVCVAFTLSLAPKRNRFACRLYPYVLVPVGDHYRISLRYACPSATANKGRRLDAQLEELREYATGFERWHREMHPHLDSSGETPPPPFGQGEILDWRDLILFAEHFTRILERRRQSLVERWLTILHIARICREARFEQVRGERLRQFLEILEGSAEEEVKQLLQRHAKPSWVGRILFRNFLAICLRKDQGVRRGVASRSRLGLMAAMWRMVRGKGKLPPFAKGTPGQNFPRAGRAFIRLAPGRLGTVGAILLREDEIAAILRPGLHGLSVPDRVGIVSSDLADDPVADAGLSGTRWAGSRRKSGTGRG